MELETIVWSNLWWERSEIKEGRLLVVGDSICCGYAPAVREKMKPVPVDSLGTSFSLDNPGLIAQLALYLETMGLKYSVIHFNNGLHGFHLSAEQYKELYEKTVQYILSHANGAKLILALSTPVTTDDPAKYDDLTNGKVLDRNKAVLEIAQKYGLEVDDLYTLVDGNVEIKAYDGYHFRKEGYDLLAEKVCEYLR